MSELCKIPTTTGLKKSFANNANEALEELESHLNPALKNCGYLRECRGCALRAEFVELPEMVTRVSARLARETVE